MEAPAEARSSSHDWALAILVGLAAWLLLELGYVDQPVHDDTAEDLLYALDCGRGRCPTHGVMTSMQGIEQGALWISLLTWLRGLGLGVDAILSFTLALSAAAVGLWFAVIAAERDRLSALAGAALFAGILVASRLLHVLWNPSLAALPTVLLCGLSWRNVHRPTVLTGVGVGVGCALLVEAHPIGLLVVPGAMVCMSMCQANRVQAAIACVGGTALACIVYFGMSWDAGRTLLRALEDRLGGIRPVALAPAAILACSLLGGAAQSWSRERRQWLMVACLCLPSVVAVAWMAATKPDFPFGPRYFVQIFPALTLIPLLVGAGRPLALVLGSSLFALASLTTRPREVQLMPLAAIESASDELESQGVTLNELWTRLSGPSCHRLLRASGALGHERGTQRELPETDLYLDFVSDSDVDELRSQLAKERGSWKVIDAPGGAVVMGELDNWVKRRQGELCPSQVDGSKGAGECEAFHLRDALDGLADVRGETLDLRQLDNIHLGGLEHALGSNARAYRIRMPVEIEPGEGARAVVMAAVGIPGCASVGFVELDGLDSPSALPARMVELHQKEQAQRGHLVFEYDLSRCPNLHLDIYPPCLIEATLGGDPWMNATKDRLLVGFASAPKEDEKGE